MERVIPLATFDAVPLWISDGSGVLRTWNRAAETLLGPAEPGCVRRCWEVVGFKTPEGSAFCSRQCPVRCRERVGLRHRVTLDRPGRDASALELLTFALPRPEGPGRPAVLHLVADRCGPDPGARRGEPGIAGARLERLTRRERQVLNLLAAGLGTDAIASRLFIARSTVRNHIQHILEKLGVHGRIDAVRTVLVHDPRGI